MGSGTAERVQRYLRRLGDLDDVRELFSELNYEPVAAAPLSRRDWPDEVQRDLADDPCIIARHGEFQIIYSRLASPQLRRGTERAVVDRLLPQFRYALFVFSDFDASDWRFINVKYDDDRTRRRVLRRYTIGPDERFGDRLRTISERLSKVALEDDELARLARAPLEIQRRYDEAFDVEAVTREFYREYRRVFEAVEGSIGGFGSEQERRRLFTQRLFNRLMFIAFIQKKGWLRLDGQHGNEYLSALWTTYRAARDRGDAANFYEERLKLLFAQLNTPHGHDGRHASQGTIVERWIGDVPYLNGGLFHQDDDDMRSDIVVPDESIELILRDLFDRFNFTVTESTPLDVEVAVDPEMLGKVFEELVTGRHESGSYYTPKPIVAFMCREALKGYLGSTLPAEPAAAIERFVEEHDPGGLRDPEAVLDALRRVRVCDPAVGSGAYLLGMLHELLDLRQALFQAQSLDPISNYRRKLEIIRNNLYGVDLDPFAVNIAQLRLWLSLAVEFDGPDPQPLPNLDFKIEQGDSVLGPEPPSLAHDPMRLQLVQVLAALKADYLTADPNQKRRLAAEIAKQEADIAALTPHAAAGNGFDWAVKFAEVFVDGGFDVILANPPYVRQELIRDIKPALKRVYGPLYSGTADLYVYFYYRALQLLRPRGMLAFISSNKWFRANYGKKLRAHIAEAAAVRSITDFGDLPVFESATAYPMIFVAEKGGVPGTTHYTEVPSLDPPYPDVRAVIHEYGQALPEGALAGEDWTLADAATAKRIQAMTAGGTTLGEYVRGRIYYGIKTGFNKAFVIDGRKRAELIAADPKSAEIIKPLVVGRDIGRWRVNYQDRWLIVTEIGVDIARYPAIFAHLSQWQPQLEKRWDKGNHWWELRACAYYNAFEAPKIVFPDIAKEPRFAIDTSRSFTGDTTALIPTEDLYLLGVLNSQVALHLMDQISPTIRGGFYRYKPQYVRQIPIAHPSPSDRTAIEGLVEKILAQPQGAEISELEAEIDARVARLYGLPSGR